MVSFDLPFLMDIYKQNSWILRYSVVFGAVNSMRLVFEKNFVFFFWLHFSFSANNFTQTRPYNVDPSHWPGGSKDYLQSRLRAKFEKFDGFSDDLKIVNIMQP